MARFHDIRFPMMNIFVHEDGALRHFWAREMLSAEDDEEQDARHVDALWNVLDLTPGGRDEFYPGLDYKSCRTGFQTLTGDCWRGAACFRDVMSEFEYRNGRPLLLEHDRDHLHLHVGRGTTTFDLSLFVAVIVVWIFDVLFIRDPLHHVLLLLLIGLGPRAFRPLVQTDVEMLDDRYTVRRRLFGVGPRTGGATADLRVDVERQGLYDAERRIAPLTEDLAPMVAGWLERRRGAI